MPQMPCNSYIHSFPIHSEFLQVKEKIIQQADSLIKTIMTEMESINKFHSNGS